LNEVINALNKVIPRSYKPTYKKAFSCGVVSGWVRFPPLTYWRDKKILYLNAYSI